MDDDLPVDLPAPDLASTLVPVLLIVGGILLVVTLLVLVIGLLQKNKSEAKESDLDASYFPWGSLLNSAERLLYEALVEASKGDFWVFPKVRLADLVRVEKSVALEDSQTAFSRIAGKRVDFVLCSPGNYHIVAVIELDDGTRDRAEQQRREQFLDGVTANAGIPVLHIKAEPTYDVEDLAEVIRELVSSHATQE